jgi:hypothetical protein
MPIAWIDVVDTAVKIGLGAAISGVTAFFIAKQSHDKSVEKEYLQKKVSVLEDVTSDIEEIVHVVFRFYSVILDWTRTLEHGNNNTEEKDKSIKELRAEIFDLFKGLTVAEGRLLLMGCKEQQVAVRNFGQLLSEFYSSSSRANAGLNSEDLKAWRLRILEERDNLYKVLGDAYRNA